MSARSPSSTSRPDLPILTSLRFFAALWVVLFHIHEIGLHRGGSPAYLSFALTGYLGVSFFFVLSGFILVYVYEGRHIAKRRFWQARLARIYPAYLFSLLVSLPALFFFWPMTTKLHLRAVTLIAYPLLLEAWFPQLLLLWNAVAWSLSAEAFFYLVFPFALPRLTALPWPHLRLWIAGSWIGSLLFTGAYVLLRPDGTAWPTSADNQFFWLGVVKLNPLVRLPEFLLGMGTGLAFLRSRPSIPPQSKIPAAAQSTSSPRNGPILLGAGVLLLGIALQRWIPYPILHSGLLAPAFALIIYGFATQPAWARFLTARPFILLGESSYSLYLLHTFFLVMGMLTFLHNPRHHAAITVLSVAVAILFSIGVYLLLERPLRRLLHPKYATPEVPMTSPTAAV